VKGKGTRKVVEVGSEMWRRFEKIESKKYFKDMLQNIPKKMVCRGASPGGE
jgi:hypothetical protein